MATQGIIGLYVETRDFAATSAHIVRFSQQGANALLGTAVTIATLSMVMSRFTPHLRLRSGHGAPGCAAPCRVRGLHLPGDRALGGVAVGWAKSPSGTDSPMCPLTHWRGSNNGG